MRDTTRTTTAFLTFVVALFGAVGQAPAGYVDGVLADDPLLYWRLGDANKANGQPAANSAATGPIVNGTYGGAVGNVADTPLLNDTDTAAHFGVTTASGSTGDKVFLNPIPPGAFPATALTTEMWVRGDMPAANQQAVLSYNASGTGGENNVLLFKNGGSFYAYVKGASVNTGMPAADLFNGEWNHLAVSWRSSDGQLNTYLNGNLAGSVTHQAGQTLNQGGSLVLTQEQDGVGGGFSNTQKFVGDLDEVAIYNKVLTPAQIASHFTANLPAYAQMVLADGPTQYWRLGEGPGATAAVNIAGGPNGTYTNAPTQGVPGPRPTAFPAFEAGNSAVDFDGSNDRVQSNSAVATMTQWTLEAWVKPDALGVSKNILSNDRGGWNDDVLFGICPEVASYSTANKFALVHQDSNSQVRTVVQAPTDAVAGQWQHVVATSDGSELRLYVNGRLLDTQARNGNDLNYGGAPVWIGGSPNAGRYFNGTIDEAAMYDRALSAAEILGRYDSTVGYDSTVPTVAAANISVPATTSNGASQWAVEQTTARLVSIGSPANVGDVEIGVHGMELRPAEGILLATVREHERDNGNGVRRATVEVGKGQFGGGVDYLTLSTTEAGYPGGIREHNVDVGVAFFPFAEGWRGAHLDPAGNILYANGITQDMLTNTIANSGRYTLQIPGAHSNSGGMLFTIGGSNEDNVVPTGVASNGTWDIRVQDNAANFNATGERDDFSLLYIPYSATDLIGGRYDGRGNRVLLSVGDFTLNRESTGVFRLNVPGHTPETGMLLLTPSYHVSSGGITAPDDNILTYQADGNDFVIHSYDLPGASGLQNTDFVFAFIPFDKPPTLTPIVNPKAVAAGNVKVIGVSEPGTLWSVEQTTAPDALTVFPTNNRADVKIGIGSNSLDYTQGILMATVRQNGKDIDGNGTIDAYATVEAVRTGSWGDGDMTLATSRAGSGQGGEFNINVAAAWFPFAADWKGGHVDNTGTLVAGHGVSQSMLTPSAAGAGAYELRLPGVNPAQHGMLFAIGGSNEDNIATTQLLGDGTGWLINVQDSNANISSEADDFSFLFMPYSAGNLVGGHVDNDAAGTVLASAGNFALTHENSGTYRLTIPGKTPEDGMLLLTILDNPGSQYTLPDDNIISYQADGGDFLIQIRDLPGLGLEATGAGFVFAYVDFEEPPYVPEPGTLTLLGLGGLIALRRRRPSR